ncbi:MAG: hypothetical protein GY875_03925 [Gammaproteobacteria bacterium]|nr:hypothetical protein [Gammaproteobacteria bacterium]
MDLISLANPRLPSYCLLLSWLMSAIGFLLGMTITPAWFARFGSLVVLFALIGEFSMLRAELSRLYEKLSNSDDGLVHSKDFTPSRWHNKKSILLHLTIVSGTIIWGFGDLVL